MIFFKHCPSQSFLILLTTMHILNIIRILIILLLIPNLSTAVWNDPYPHKAANANIIYSAFSERPKHLDPVRSYSANEYAFIAQIYEPPLQYHFLKRPPQLLPLTLVNIPKPIFLDATENILPKAAPITDTVYSDYLLELRPGMRYQPHPALAKDTNGQYLYHNLTHKQIAAVRTLADFPKVGSREVIAADYAYQISRMARSKLHCPIAGILKEYILGFKAATEAINQAESQTKTGYHNGVVAYLDLRNFPITGVKVLGRYRLRIRLKGRYPQFLYWLAMPFFAPMPWEAERFYSQPGMERRNISLDWYPIGSGPFMLTENNPNLRMVLSRNPNYHVTTYPNTGAPQDANMGLLADAGRRLPLVNRAIYSLEREDIPYWNKFLQGFYDLSGISSDSFDQAIRFNDQGEAGLTKIMQQRKIKLDTAISPSIYYLGFNMQDPVVGGTSKRAQLLRQAIAIAVDFEEFITIFANGRGVAAQGPIPPGIFGYKESSYNQYTYDWKENRPKRKPLAVAKALLAQAGYPHGRNQDNGKVLALYYDTAATGPDGKARLSWMHKQFKRLGIQLVIRATDYSRFQEKMRTGNTQLYMWGWNADYPDPENFLFMLYGPNSKKLHGGENTSNYNNPEFNKLFERMKTMDNSPKRQVIIDRMLEIVRREVPWAGGFHPKSFTLRHAWVYNTKSHQVINNTLKYRRIDPQLRAYQRYAWNQPITWPLWLLLGILILAIIPAYVSLRQRELQNGRAS